MSCLKVRLRLDFSLCKNWKGLNWECKAFLENIEPLLAKLPLMLYAHNHSVILLCNGLYCQWFYADIHSCFEIEAPILVLAYWRRLTSFRSQISRLLLLRSVHWCNLNFLPFLLFCIHFLYIAICFGCLFKIMKLYYPLKKPGYDSIIKTKDFIANAMSLILIGTTYRVEPLPKLCGVLYHTLLDWSWWSYAGSNGQLLNQGNQIFDCH